MKKTVPKSLFCKSLFLGLCIVAVQVMAATTPTLSTPYISSVETFLTEFDDGNAGFNTVRTIQATPEREFLSVTTRIQATLDRKLLPRVVSFPINDGNAGFSVGRTIQVAPERVFSPVIELLAETGDANTHVSAFCAVQTVTVPRVSGGVRSKTKEVLNDVVTLNTRVPIWHLIPA